MRPRDTAEVRARIAAAELGGGPEAMRPAFAALLGPAPPFETTGIGGIPAGIFGDGARRIVWLHGGGYVFGSAASHGTAAAWLARASGCTVIVPEYRLAPEHPWPAQRDDALAVIDAWDGPLALVGDSAGGHLALVAALARPGRIAALALLSPNTDRTGKSTTRRPNSARDAMNADADDARLARMAMGGRDPADPEVSPLGADLSRLPPLHIAVATTEVLLDDSLLLAAEAARAGAAVELVVTPGLFHLWPLWPDAIPEGAATLDGVAAFLVRHLGAAPEP